MKSFFPGVALGLMLLAIPASSPADGAEQVRARIESRRPIVAELVRSGAVVETAEGFLSIRDAGAVGAKADVIAAENSDRKKAYDAIAEKTGVPSRDVGRHQAIRIRAAKP